MSFAADVSTFCKKTGVKANTVLKKIAFDGLAGVILKSPVDTGRFKGNWRVGINRVDLTTDEESYDPTGAKTIAEGQAKMKSVVFGDTIYISNNLPYAEPLEHGHSKQAPQGMLWLTHQELVLEINRVVGEVSRA